MYLKLDYDNSCTLDWYPILDKLGDLKQIWNAFGIDKILVFKCVFVVSY